LKIENIDVDSAINTAQEALKKEKGVSPALRAALGILILLVTILLNRVSLNSKNSSKPPSSDPNREKKSRKGNGQKKQGGQKGHKGTTLEPFDDPDVVKESKIDRRTLPKGRKYREVGYEARQVLDLKITRLVTEYRSQILEDEQGNRFVASFPDKVNRPVQYGSSVKAHSVYMSQHQLTPYDRVCEHFQEQMQIPLSIGSIFNFNKEAYEKLEFFEDWARQQLINSSLAHSDETGVNIGGKGHWLHVVSNSSLTLFYPHKNRGTKAMDEMGVLPLFRGTLCHDHWKPYYCYTDCLNSLCNAHHLRELECAYELDGQQWAAKMKKLLPEISKAVDKAGGCLRAKDALYWRKRYRKILKEAEIECPPPDESQRKGRRGRLKRSKSRNLLERLRDFEDDVLRFMEVVEVPFTNNQAENDLRMTKVQQKISGCFRSMVGAKIFCRVRSYLSTCRKNGISATEALTLLFEGKKPKFMQEA